MSRFEGVIKDTSAEALGPKEESQTVASSLQIAWEGPLPMHLKMPNSSIRERHYDTSEGEEDVGWEDDELSSFDVLEKILVFVLLRHLAEMDQTLPSQDGQITNRVNLVEIIVDETWDGWKMKEIELARLSWQGRVDGWKE
ncbi:hypothetical protein QYF36_018920 [Acer negundo]|nr:hypothetical protein QYF36_018920 [Acer negundo]